MALPQWRDVNAPNFSGAADSLQMFSQLLNQGLSTAKSTFREFDQSKSDEVNRAIEMQLAQIQDPDQARAQAAALLAGANKDRISSAMISAIGRRPGEVQQQALTDLNFNRTRDQFADDAKWKAAFSAAAPELAALEEVRKGGDFKAINAAQEKVYNALAKGGASAERIYNFAGQLDGRVNAGFDMMSGRTNFDRNSTRWDQEQLSYAERQQAEEIAGNLRKQYLTSEDALAALNGMSGLNGRVYNGVAQALGIGGFVDNFSSGEGGPLGGTPTLGGTSSSGDPTRVMNYEARASGFASIPDNVQNLGQAVAFAKQVNQANMARMGKPGSSAMGMYQIVGSTMSDVAPKVFGANWQSVPLTAENQDKLAKHIFENNRGSAKALKNQWVSLDMQTAEAVRKMPWEQAREYITRRESRSSAAQVLAGVMTDSKTNTASTADYVGENFGNSIPEKLSALSNQNDVNARQVAATMAKSYNLDTNWTETAINRLIARSRERGDGKRPINAAMAGQILQDTIQSRSQEGWLSWLRPDLHIAGKNTFSFNPGSLGNGMSYNIEAAEKAVDGWVAGNVDKVAAKNEGRRAAAGQEAMYKQQAQALQQRINARIEAATRRGVRTDVSADVAKLNELLRLAGESTEGRGYFTQDPVGDPAPPRAPAPRTSVPKPPAVTRAPSAPRSDAFKTDNRGQYVDHSSAASRSRASAMLGNALMAINPVYWLGRAIDGK